MKINKKNLIDSILLSICIAISGFPYFTLAALHIPIFILLTIFFLQRKRQLDKNILLFLVFLLIITLIQTLVFNFYAIQTIVGVFLRVINAYLIVKILGNNFISCFINILYVISIISLIVYFPILLSPQIGELLLNLSNFFEVINIADSEHPNILVYNLHHIESDRNSGPFWEPGAFAGYLMPAYMFNTLSKNSQSKKTIIFFITIISTLSTTAYIGLFIFYFLLYFHKIKNILLRYIVYFIIISSASYSFFNLDFLNKKIQHQFESAKNLGAYGSDDTQRFINILRDMEDFRGHEIIGRGSSDYTRFLYDPENQIRTVGLTDILVRYGLPFFTLIMVLLYRSLSDYFSYNGYKEKIYSIGAFLAILTLLMSEVYFNFPIYWCFLFLTFVYSKPKNKYL